MISVVLVLVLHFQGFGIGNKLTVPVCKQHRAFSRYCWVPNYKGRGHKNYTQFWSLHGHEVVQQIQTPPVLHSSLPVILYLRCGDILTSSHIEYPIQSAKCLSSVIWWLRPYTRVTLMAAGHSKSTQAETRLKQACICEELIVKALRVLRGTFDVEIRRVRDAWEDWWTLHRAQKVLALIPSSFAFSAKAGALREIKILGAHDNLPVWVKCNATNNVAPSSQWT